MPNPDKQLDARKSTVSPLSIYIAGHGTLETPMQAEGLFRTMESIANGSPQILAIVAKIRADYERRLNWAKTGIDEIIDEATENIKISNGISEDGLMEILKRAISRGVLSYDGKFVCVDYIERAQNLCDLANQKLAEINHTGASKETDEEPSSEEIAKSQSLKFLETARQINGVIERFEGVKFSCQINVDDSRTYRVIRIYNLTSEKPIPPEELSYFKKKYEKVHIPGIDAPIFIINMATLFKKEWGEVKQEIEERRETVRNRIKNERASALSPSFRPDSSEDYFNSSEKKPISRKRIEVKRGQARRRQERENKRRHRNK